VPPYKDQRKEFDEILDYVINQTEKIAVCFDKVDRLSRNIFDVRVSQLYERALRDEVELHFVSDNQVINSQLSAVEKFNFSISLGLAKYYSDAISDNVKRAIEEKLRKGEWPGKAPYGYKNITLENEKKDIVVEEYESKMVQKVCEWYSTGAYSMDLIRKKLKDEYGLEWSKGTIDKILKETFYYGVMTMKSKQYPHKYPPIITKEIFDRVQQVKTSHNKKKFKYAGLPYIYRGLVRCSHCDCAITPEKHKGQFTTIAPNTEANTGHSGLERKK
jgi:site-specific DNA recombinase